MQDLISSIVSARKKIKNYTNSIIKEKLAQKFPENLTRWRGKKLVSEREWDEMVRRRTEASQLYFMPDDFIENLFGPYTNFAGLERQFSRWYNDYEAYLNFSKNSNYAKYCCEAWCIMHPDPRTRIPKIIKDIILKFFVDQKYPCTVLNKFECPYGQFEKDAEGELVEAMQVCELLGKALYYRQKDTENFDVYTFRIDFEKEPRQKQSDVNKDDQSAINDLENFKHPIRTIKDLYNILTDEKKLEWVLTDYIEFGLKEDRTFSLVEDREDLDRLKGKVIEMFSKIKNKIKLKELRNLSDETFVEEQKKIKENLVKREIIVNEKKIEFQRNELEFGKCSKCEIFCNIFCLNCDQWMCHDHWHDHFNYHNKLSKSKNRKTKRNQN